MYNILIFGTGSTCELILNVLNMEKVRILAFLDNDSSKWGDYFYERKIVPPSEIYNYSYDYIIIASQYNESIYNQLLHMDVDNKKVLQFYKFYNLLYNPLKRYIDTFYKKVEELSTIITGISYVRSGIDENGLIHKGHNFALGSQDLFYDYKIVEHILNSYKKNKIKYAIIGLAYYSFQYDMSLSSMRNRVILYYSVLGEKHNYKELSIKDFNNQYNISKSICDKIFKKNEKGDYLFKWNSQILSNHSVQERINLGKRIAHKDCNKNYPKTVEENKIILKKYLKLLKDNNIKPIVVVFPSSKYYTKYFSKRIEDEFHSIIKQTKKEYEFQYIDYFRSDIFENDDFSDVSHLNNKGAEKFTKILNKEIQW
ncbi:TPA: chemotaxis protein [Clostridium botulinum]|uniref:nucleoside-diphosphate sugar epimerase/dehydratase n=1 Tax=Clostridium botulinum TaxID=1491 RepID=UPI00099D7D65|nr:chemotaxis protein [Clostridium botulinum]NFA95928.1 chemotaxis protein [Clostridium botulinum]NFB53034.1 chemotaxis protein [Clostridium botulinum]NFB56524.1 chemotaxis protein [Clostridium botulinum]NFB60811.1 chemotaxis protein [Clostridium botulinum]NFC78425.1 chemotaxis protein [Clostridium botulinum]